MPAQNFIDVRILSDGSALPEYQHIELDNDGKNSLSRYIEVVTDQSFQVQCTLLPSYDFRSARFVTVELYIDGEEAPWHRYFERSKKRVKHGKLKHTLSETFITVPCLDGMTNRWEERSFSFGDLTFSKLKAEITWPLTLLLAV
jgi:hypothetical protein